MLSGRPHGRHGIRGLGAGFIPPLLDTDGIDEIVRIADETAFATARSLARLEGISAGASSGATVAAAVEIGRRRAMAGRVLVAVLPSSADPGFDAGVFEGL